VSQWTLAIERGQERGERVLTARVRVPRPRDQVFRFFADPENLERLTPPELAFRILTTPGPLQEGSLIRYRLQLFRVPFSWLTRIAIWDPPHEFADDQLRGPYARWYHRHRFLDDGDGTWIEDEVHFRLPLYPLGEVAAPLVTRQLRRIFTYRRNVLLRVLTR
jgi:ligand-binding SRPBCC domain-containing protein